VLSGTATDPWSVETDLMSVSKTRPARAFFAGVTSAVVLLGLAGCGGQPQTGNIAVEPPEVQERRESTIKDMMKKGAYGDQYKNKVP
jgi:hypothetical protein